jgi:hypothetical protein
MKRHLWLSAGAMLALTTLAWAGGPLCLNHGIHCITPPCPDCPDCSGPCERGHHHCSCRKSERAHQLIEQLQAECCCDRIRAAAKLGCRLHADFCCDPEVLTALAHALQCDPCWEVRKTAAWSIAFQKGRTELGVLSLYLASKLDPHFLVRDAATDALAVLLVCRRDCFKDTFARGDALIKELKGKYKPGTAECLRLFDECCAVSAVQISPVTPVPAAQPVEKLKVNPAPLPKGSARLPTGTELSAQPTVIGIN